MRTFRLQQHGSRPSDEDAIREIIRVQQLCVSEVVRYTAELVAFDSENSTDMASQFRRDVLPQVQREEYQAAINGLDRFINNYLVQDPLMRVDFGGLIAVIRPALVLLTNAQRNGLDTQD